MAPVQAVLNLSYEMMRSHTLPIKTQIRHPRYRKKMETGHFANSPPILIRRVV